MIRYHGLSPRVFLEQKQEVEYLRRRIAGAKHRKNEYAVYKENTKLPALIHVNKTERKREISV